MIAAVKLTVVVLEYVDDLKSRILAFDAKLTTNGTNATLFEIVYSNYIESVPTMRQNPLLLDITPGGSELLNNPNQYFIWYQRGIGPTQVNIGIRANPGLTNYNFHFVI